jgi:uncharacterized membrane protein YuzA (DUF378 family)
MAMDKLKKSAVIVAAVGALNWGLVQLLDFNVVQVVSELPVLSTIGVLQAALYITVGAAGAYVIVDETGLIK